MKRILFLLFTMLTLAGYAQYPITSINITMPANPPANTSDWATALPPVMITAQAQMRNGQMPGDVIESKILVTIKQGGSKKYGSYTPDNAPSAGFTTAVKNWSGSNATTLLGSVATLPPGTYELCVQFFTLNTPAKPLSNEVCKTFTIQGSKEESYTPPVNANPVDKKVFTEKEISAPITFRWTPVLPRPTAPIIYKVRIWEVGVGNNVDAVRKTEQPIQTLEVKDQTQTVVKLSQRVNYGLGYVWDVQAIGQGEKIIKVSEPTVFSVNADETYTPPVNESPADKKIFTESDIKSPITFRWTPLCCKPRDPITYKLRVWQIKEGQQGTQAIKTNKPVVEKEVKNASQYVKQNLMGDIEMIGGSANLIWNVQAVNEQGTVLGSSETTAFSLASNCSYNFKLSVTSVECLGSQNGFNNYRVCINSYFQSGSLNLTYLASGSGISATHPSFLPAYAVTAITPALTSQSSGAATNKAYCFSVAVPVGQASVIIGLQGDDNNPSPTITCQPGGDTLINLPKCPQTDCCRGGSWGEKLRINDNGSSSALDACGSNLGTAPCGYSSKLNVIYKCNPNCNTTAQIIYQYYNAVTNAPVGPSVTVTSGTTATITNPSVSGSYYLSIAAKCGDKICDECKLYFKLDCQPNDCCKGSKWGEQLYYKADTPISFPTATGGNIGEFRCGDNFKTNICFTCTTNCGTAQIKYDIYVAYSLVLISSVTKPACSLENIPLPTIARNYQLVITPICNGKECPGKDYIFSVACPPTDCCKGGSWGEKLRINTNASTSKLDTCGSNLGTAPCGYSGKFNVTYKCNPNCNTTAQIIYQYYNAVTNAPVGASVTVTSGTTATITNPSVSGSYYLSIAAKCGDKMCDECKLYFKLDCPPTDCCKGGSWGEKLRINTNGSSSKLDTCGSNLGTAPCGFSGKFNVTYKCNPNCNTTAQITYQYYNAITNTPVGVSVTVASGTTATITNPSVSGSYYLSIAAKCGDKICDECKLYFKLDCQPNDCCKGSKWISKSIGWDDLIKTDGGGDSPNKVKKEIPSSGGPIGLPPTSINISKCDSTYHLGQGGTYTFNADYQCVTANCTKKLFVTIKGIGNSWYDGTFAMPKTITFTNAGNYAITYIAICGTDTCARCPFVLTIDRNCCLGSHWNKAEYQIVNLNADGSWNRSDPTFYNLLGGGIPTLKADLGISIENLGFQCAADKTCRPGYIIKRRKLIGGALVEPDETLPFGQISTSIYSKPFPQIITIVPTCGGQPCGPVIIFKLECLHKDCIPPATITDGEDALLHSLTSLRSANFGGSTANAISNWTFDTNPAGLYSVIKFNIPAGMTAAMVSTAKLSLREYISVGNGNHAGQYGGANKPTDFVIRRVTSTWSQSTVTWNTMPSTTTTNQVFIPGYTGGSANDDLDIDVTQLVKDILNSGSNQGFMIRFNDNSLTDRYRSRWFGSFECPVISKKPTLIIN